MMHTVVISTNALDMALLQHPEHSSEVAMGEHLRDNSMNAVTTSDDLFKQDMAYRQIFVLLRCPPGLETHPVDIKPKPIEVQNADPIKVTQDAGYEESTTKYDEFLDIKSIPPENREEGTKNEEIFPP